MSFPLASLLKSRKPTRKHEKHLKSSPLCPTASRIPSTQPNSLGGGGGVDTSPFELMLMLKADHSSDPVPGVRPTETCLDHQGKRPGSLPGWDIFFSGINCLSLLFVCERGPRFGLFVEYWELHTAPNQESAGRICPGPRKRRARVNQRTGFPIFPPNVIAFTKGNSPDMGQNHDENHQNGRETNRNP